jgi:hypothetical protein
LTEFLRDIIALVSSTPWFLLAVPSQRLPPSTLKLSLALTSLSGSLHCFYL